MPLDKTSRLAAAAAAAAAEKRAKTARLDPKFPFRIIPWFWTA